MAILVVDDSPDQLVLIRALLRSAGYDVITAVSMNAALDYLLKAQDSFENVDLILLDVLMPVDDGFQACRRIKAVESLEEIPIIMVSSAADPDTVQLAFTEGAIDYIRKPIIKGELLARVRVALKLREETTLRRIQGDQVRELTQRLEAANKVVQAFDGVDALTGLMTWECFNKAFSEEWLRAAQENVAFSLMFFSIADFKTFNDTCGYLSGDECLQRLARVTKNTLTGPRQVAARYRGAEFIVMLPDVREDEAQSLATTLRKNVDALELGLAVHIGVATVCPNRGTSRVTLLALVKQALARAKQNL